MEDPSAAWLHSITFVSQESPYMSWLHSMTLFHHRVSLLQSMTAVTTCNYPFVVFAVQQLCIQYEYLEVDELSSEWIVGGWAV